MLEGMRKASQGAVGKFIMTIVMGLIIVSFVIWGVGDMLRGFSATTVAKVGATSISSQAYGNELQSELYRLQRQVRQPLTAQQARALGLDAEVLDRMIDEAAFDERARAMGLAISDDTIAQTARSDPRLKGPDGKFDRGKFDEDLRDAGLSERGFFAEQRNVYLRQQIQYSLVDGLEAPKTLVQALLDAKNETRAIAYYTLVPAAAGDIPAPSDDALKTYFEAHKAVWRAPEYRGFDALLVTPTTLAKPDSVSDEDARKQYEKDKETKYTVPEKRKLQQIVFPSEAEAAEAAARIKAGTSFDDIAKARKLSDADLNIGEVTKAGVFDQAVAAAAFALPQGGVSAPIKGDFGYVIVKDLTITPGSVKPFDDVKAAVKQQIAASRAVDQVQSLRDKIEDSRGNGKPLAEAAKSVGLATRAYLSDRTGKTSSGVSADVVDKDQLLPAAFASDIGVDDEPIATKDGGYVWFSVTKIDPAHDRGFDEVKDKVAAAWRADETAKRLARFRGRGRQEARRRRRYRRNRQGGQRRGQDRQGRSPRRRRRARRQCRRRRVRRRADGGRLRDDARGPSRVQGDRRHHPGLRSRRSASERNRGSAEDGDQLVAGRTICRCAEATNRRDHRPSRDARRRGRLMDVEALYAQGRAAVLTTTLVADLETPVSAYLKLAASRAGDMFLLEFGGGRRAARPLFDDRARPRPRVPLERRQGRDQPATGPRPRRLRALDKPPLEALRALLAESRIDLPARPAADVGGRVRLSRLRHGAADGAPRAGKGRSRSACPRRC